MSGRIVHLSGDFPDSWEPAKTRVVETLVELVADRFDQQVISLNRRSPGPSFYLSPRPGLRIATRRDGEIEALRYTAPPRGIWHWRLLRELGERLADELGRGEKPALIVGHKLTIEGVAAARAAQLLGIPYALSIQGDTDTKILAARPDLRARFRTVFHGAAMVFPFAPWALAAVEERLGRREGPVTMLPCPTRADTPRAPRAGGTGLVTAFHLRSRRRKNLGRLLRAAELAHRARGDTTLAILGGGSEADEAAVARAIGGRGFVTREGAVPHDAIGARFNRATGFVLPSLRESFGLVFVEALFAGLPVAYPKGAAVDGYFDGLPFAIPTDARDPAAIAEAMLRLIRDEAALKAELARWQASEHARQFRREGIAAAFEAGLALAASATPCEAAG